MISGDDYRMSLRDGRAVWLDGERVDDVTSHPLLARSVDWVARTYDRHVGELNPMFALPGTVEELGEQATFLLEADPTAASTAGCVALATVAEQLPHGERLTAYVDSCRERDIRVAGGLDDTAKPVRVDSRRRDGIVVSGGKQHVVGAAVSHELLVVPDGGDVAVAVPLNAPGVRIISTTTAPRAADDRHFPISRDRSISEAIVVLDEVFVPDERVFLESGAGADAEDEVASTRAEHATVLASTLNVWERSRAVAAQADRAELLLGLAQTISEMNGIERVPHVRDKLSAMAVYAKMCRAGWDAALANADITGGMVRPDDSYLFATKSYGSQLYSQMVNYLHDVSGGAVITAPTIGDLDNPDTGDYMRKYMRTMDGVSGEDRVRIFHIIRDLTADTYAGWDKVTNQVVGGGMHEQRMSALDTFDLTKVKARARSAAGIVDEPAGASA